MSSRSARAGERSSSTSRPRASLVATCTPWSFDRSCPGTTHDRRSVPPASYSNTRERWLLPDGFTYVPAYTRPFGCTYAIAGKPGVWIRAKTRVSHRARCAPAAGTITSSAASTAPSTQRRAPHSSSITSRAARLPDRTAPSM